MVTVRAIVLADRDFFSCCAVVDEKEPWSEEIVSMWRFTRNNGITEGFHNKMELINRQAYGFRN